MCDKNFYFPDILNKTNTIYQLYKQTIDNYNEFVKNDIKQFVISMKHDIDSNSFYSPTKVIEKIDSVAAAFFKNIIESMDESLYDVVLCSRYYLVVPLYERWP